MLAIKIQRRGRVYLKQKAEKGGGKKEEKGKKKRQEKVKNPRNFVWK